MSWPTRIPTLRLLTICACAAACSTAPDTARNSAAGAVGTSGTPTPFTIEVSQTYLTIENRTGVPLAAGEIEIIPGGFLKPFKTSLSRLDSGERRPVMLNAFIGNDGMAFRRGLVRGRRVRVTATDVNGKTYEQEVPFE